MNKEEIKKEIERLYEKWSSVIGINEYEKLKLKKLEEKYKQLK